MLAGPAQQCFEDVIQYTTDRKAFDKPLNANQHIQFKLAAMATDITTSRLLVRQAAKALDSKAPNAIGLCAMAKLHATEKLYKVQII